MLIQLISSSLLACMRKQSYTCLICIAMANAISPKKHRLRCSQQKGPELQSYALLTVSDVFLFLVIRPWALITVFYNASIFLWGRQGPQSWILCTRRYAAIRTCQCFLTIWLMCVMQATAKVPCMLWKRWLLRRQSTPQVQAIYFNFCRQEGVSVSHLTLCGQGVRVYKLFN